ncbi:hypothetical protein ACTFIZ_009090 [Dictyostelium cf. discoideum]
MTITFKVTDIKEEKVIKCDEFSFEKFIKDEYINSIENQNIKVLKSSFNNEKLNNIKRFGSNSFIFSAWVSYNLHHHLSIKPDNIWMAIQTQFSLYVKKNSEQLREKFVDFKEKKSIIIKTKNPILDAPFDEITIEISNQIQSLIKDPSLKDWIIPNFTTTKESDKVAFSIVLMSTLKDYFKYTIQTACGLPQVTLHGEVNDWINLKERVLCLKKFDLIDKQMTRWCKFLIPIMDKFIESANGNLDIKWWNQIANLHQKSGGPFLTGWISSFCVFDDLGNFEIKSSKTEIDSEWPIVNCTKISKGFVSAPIQLIDSDGTEYSSNIYAGHIASEIQDDSIIIPLIDWLILTEIK